MPIQCFPEIVDMHFVNKNVFCAIFALSPPPSKEGDQYRFTRKITGVILGNRISTHFFEIV